MTTANSEQRQQVFEFADVQTFCISVADCEFLIRKTEETPRVDVVGTAHFLDDVRAHCDDGRLTVQSTERHASVSIVSVVKAMAGLGNGLKNEGSIVLYVPKGIDGEIRVMGSGDGDVLLPLGRLRITIQGSGDVDALEARELDVTISGSGDVSVERVTEQAVVAVSGSGDVTLASGTLSTLQASVNGSGDIDAHVTAATAILSVHGSGDITVDRVSGDVQQHVRGSGDITILKTGE